MNQALNSVVKTMPTDSDDYTMVQSLCANAVDENVVYEKVGKWATFQKLLLKVGQSNLILCSKLQTSFFFKLKQMYNNRCHYRVKIC